jgi:hypothetical protein
LAECLDGYSGNRCSEGGDGGKRARVHGVIRERLS